jgi:hypothetical protein
MMDTLWRHREQKWIAQILSSEDEFKANMKEIETAFNSTGLDVPAYEHILPIARSVANGHQVIPQHCQPDGPHECVYYSLDKFEERFAREVDINCLVQNKETINKMTLSANLTPKLGYKFSAFEKLKCGAHCEMTDCSDYASLWDEATGQVFCPNHAKRRSASPEASNTGLDLTSKTSPSGVASMTSSDGMTELQEKAMALSKPTSTSLSREDDKFDALSQTETSRQTSPLAPLTPAVSSHFSSPSSLGLMSAVGHPSTKSSWSSLPSKNTHSENESTSAQSGNGKLPHSGQPPDDTIELVLSQFQPGKVQSSTVEYLDAVFGVELWNDFVEDIELGNQKCTSKNHGLYNMACSYAPKLLVSFFRFLCPSFLSLLPFKKKYIF